MQHLPPSSRQLESAPLPRRRCRPLERPTSEKATEGSGSRRDSAPARRPVGAPQGPGSQPLARHQRSSEATASADGGTSCRCEGSRSGRNAAPLSSTPALQGDAVAPVGPLAPARRSSPGDAVRPCADCRSVARPKGGSLVSPSADCTMASPWGRAIAHWVSVARIPRSPWPPRDTPCSAWH